MPASGETRPRDDRNSHAWYRLLKVVYVAAYLALIAWWLGAVVEWQREWGVIGFQVLVGLLITFTGLSLVRRTFLYVCFADPFVNFDALKRRLRFGHYDLRPSEVSLHATPPGVASVAEEVVQKENRPLQALAAELDLADSLRMEHVGNVLRERDRRTQEGAARRAHGLPWKCPRCGIINIATSERCDCGFRLVAATNAAVDSETQHRTAEAVASPPCEVQPSVPRPWFRFLARFLDLCLAGMGTGLGLGLFGERVSTGTLIVSLLIWIPIESAFLAFCGTTPGKWFLGIRVIGKDGHTLSYLACLKRNFYRFCAGEAFWLPLVPLATMATAHHRLQKKGITLWDAECGAVVQHGPIGVGRALGFLAAVLSFFLLMYFGSFGAK